MWYIYTVLKANSYAILFQEILRIFTVASGYLVPNMIRFGQNRVLWGLFVGINVPPRYIFGKISRNVFFAVLFQPLLTVIENTIKRNLGGISQLCMGFRLGGLWAMTDHDDTGVATLVHSWYTAPVHRPPRRARASVSPWPISRVLWPSSSSCATKKLLILPKQQSYFVLFFLRRPQATRAPWERELLAGPATRKALTQLPWRFRIPFSFFEELVMKVDRPTRYGSIVRVVELKIWVMFCSPMK